MTMSTRTKAPGRSPESPLTATVTLTVPVVGSTAGAMRSMMAPASAPVASAARRTSCPGLQTGDVTLGDVDVGIQRVEVGEIVDRGAIGDGGSDVEVAGHHHSGDRCPDDGARELELGELEGVLGVLGQVPAGLEVVETREAPVVEP